MLKKIKKQGHGLLKLSLLVVVMLVAPYTSDKIHRMYLYDYKGASVVRVTKLGSDGLAGGTGFQVEYNGKMHILTNLHVCEAADERGRLDVETQDGKHFIRRVIKKYEKHDLCVLAPIQGLRPLSIAGSSHKREPVHVVGHPRLDPLTMQSGFAVAMIKITIGYIRNENESCFGGAAAEDAFLTTLLPIGKKACVEKLNTLHINAVSYGGNSGSPILDDFGNVVAVLFAGRRDAVTATYCVPLSHIKKFLGSL